MVGNNHNFLAKIAKKLKEIIKRNKTMFADLDEIDKDMIIDYTIAVYLAIGNCVKRQLILYATCHHYLLMN